MTTSNDRKVLDAILNCETGFEEENQPDQTKSKYEPNVEIEEAKKLEIEGVKSAEKNDLKQSIECFTLAIEKAPLWASAYNNRAQALRLTGDIDGALSDLNKAIELATKYEDFKVLSLALTQKGTILRLNGKDEEALACFELAAKYGNKFAKQQAVILNPFAKLCNAAFKKMQQELY